MLAASIRESLRPPAAPNELPPRTPDEFAAKFEGVEGMIDAFMKKYESGQLGRLGWDSSEWLIRWTKRGNVDVSQISAKSRHDRFGGA